MLKTPYGPDDDQVYSSVAAIADSSPLPDDWRVALPTMTGSLVTLRELKLSDAPVLHALLSTDDVARFISPLSTTVEVFERFVVWAHRRRAAGEFACFAVVPRNSEQAVGLFRVRSLAPGFATAEWGFALAEAYWGTGMFVDSARLALDFVFAAIGANRLEARAAVQNGRGNGALRKIGAVRECVLRDAFFQNGEYLDEALWSILREEWHEALFVARPRTIH